MCKQQKQEVNYDKNIDFLTICVDFHQLDIQTRTKMFLLLESMLQYLLTSKLGKGIMMFHQSADMKVECLKITLLVVVVFTQKQVQTRLLLCGIFFTRKYIFPFFKTLWCSHCCYCSYKFRDQAIVCLLCSTDITKIYLPSYNLKP